VAVNCAAIPETLLEAELFGFERGAFTDARHAKAGLFQTAHRGTLFLDEIGLLPQNLQAKLLTVLEDRAVRRLGSTRTEAVNIWIITASSEDLRAGARKQRFREDLFYRLAGVTLWLPPLRERGQDILILAEHFLAQTCTDYGLAPKALADDARAALLAYRWPGNVRELANLMERVALLIDGPLVTAAKLELAASRGRPAAPPQGHDITPPGDLEGLSLEQTVEQVERRQILQALHETRGNISRAASRLGVTRNILRYRLQKYGLRASAGTAAPITPADPVSPTVETTTDPTPVTVQWERRHVALLRADLVTTSSVRAMSGAGLVLETLVKKVYSFGGQVEEVSPRRLLAVFGLEPVEDAPRRAAHAALAIQKVAAHAGRSSAEFQGVRVGLHVREVLVARVGSAVRVDHEEKREAWLTLEAFMGSAEAGTVLVSGATCPFLARRFVLTPFAVSDGTAGRVYRLVGLERTGLGLGEQLTPFVARSQELEQLAQALEHVLQGHGQIVAVVGEAGVGKSRLLWEFINSHRIRNSLILVSSAASYGKGTPYLPLIDLLKAYFHIEPRDDADKVRERIAEKVLSLEGALASALSALLALLDVPDPDAQWSALDPSQKRQRTLEAVKLLLVEESRSRPVILVFEDLQWIDSETQAVLDTLVESLPGHRVLLLVSYRPEYQHTWGSKSYYAQVRLDPLSPESAHSLLDRLVGRDEATAALKAVLIERTSGNPFFLEESVRTLIETGVLSGNRGAYRVARPSGEICVPATVQAVLAARIDRLPPEDKTLLQTAAVIGKDVPFALLGAVADQPEELLRAGLMRLQGNEFLYETRLVPEMEYAFKHALSHEVAYAGLLQDRRRALHARIMLAIERLHASRLTEQVDRLAQHAICGEVWDKAVAYFRQAGAKAAGRSALRQAAACYEQALAALERLPESRERMEQAIDLRFDLRTPLLLLGEIERGLDHLRQAQALAEALGDHRRLGWVSFYLIAYLRFTGHETRALEAGQRALAIGEKLGDSALHVATVTQLGIVYGTLGDYRRATEILRRNVESLTGPRARERFGLAAVASVQSGGYLSWYLAELGEFTEALARAEERLKIAESVDDLYTLAQACTMVGLPALLKGTPEQAIPVVERGLDLCRSMHFRHLFPSAASCLGGLYALAGRSGEAIPLLDEAVEAAASIKRKDRCSIFLARLGEAHLEAGRPDRATESATRALELAREQRERGHEAYALRLLAEIASQAAIPEVEKAEAFYCQALALAGELGMRPLVAHCHLGLGKLYGRTGKRQQTLENLTTATTLYRDMDMRFWLAQAEVRSDRGRMS
jgi:tetratricopeptide (TPR) repeat protein/transposase-like protein